MGDFQLLAKTCELIALHMNYIAAQFQMDCMFATVAMFALV